MIEPTPPSGPPIAKDNDRKAGLAHAIEEEVLAGGRVEAQGELNAVIRFGKPVNHVLHLLLTLVTFGVWGLVWFVMVYGNHNYAVTLNVDEYGNVTRQTSEPKERAAANPWWDDPTRVGVVARYTKDK